MQHLAGEHGTAVGGLSREDEGAVALVALVVGVQQQQRPERLCAHTVQR